MRKRERKCACLRKRGSVCVMLELGRPPSTSELEERERERERERETNYFQG